MPLQARNTQKVHLKQQVSVLLKSHDKNNLTLVIFISTFMKLFLEKFKFILIDNSRKIPYIYCLFMHCEGSFKSLAENIPESWNELTHYNTNIENKS